MRFRRHCIVYSLLFLFFGSSQVAASIESIRKPHLSRNFLLASSSNTATNVNVLEQPSTTEGGSPPASSTPPPPPLSSALSLPRRKMKKAKGKLTIDLHGNSMRLFPANHDHDDANNNNRNDRRSYNHMDHAVSVMDVSTYIRQHSAVEYPPEQISISMGPHAAFRFAKLGFGISTSFFTAFVGTLRLLAPLILSRRAINAAGDLVFDYMRGRYIRKTYSRLENVYIRFYELPAAFRAVSRTLAQISILHLLSFLTTQLMVTIPGIKSPVAAPGCWWAGILWALTTVGSGHLCTSALATWGGPLRIQVNASHSTARRLSRVFTRPWHILQWMKDPEAWITTMSLPRARQPFNADPILFPATWAPLQLLQMIGVAGALSRPNVLSEFLVHVSLAAEWYRTFVSERRVGLGLIVVVSYLISTVMLIFTIVNTDVGSVFFMIPHLLAVIVSSWMNLIIFWNRMDEKHRERIYESYFDLKHRYSKVTTVMAKNVGAKKKEKRVMTEST